MADHADYAPQSLGCMCAQGEPCGYHPWRSAPVAPEPLVRVGRVFLVTEAARESLLLDLDEAARRNGAKVVAGSSSTEPPERSRGISDQPQPEWERRLTSGEIDGSLDAWGRSPDNADYGQEPPEGSTRWIYWHEHRVPWGVPTGGIRPEEDR